MEKIENKKRDLLIICECEDELEYYIMQEYFEDLVHEGYVDSNYNTKIYLVGYEKEDK